MKSLLKFAGKTQDEKVVVSGVFQFFETYGLSLDVIITALDKNNLVIDWLDFFDAAHVSGMKRNHIISKLEEAITSSHDETYCVIIINRLKDLRK